MRDLDLLVPSALLPSARVAPDLGPQLLRDVSLPALSRILAQAASDDIVVQSRDAALATWQAWLFARRDGLAPEAVNLAELWAAACGGAPAGEPRWLLEPAHFQIARDHLRLNDPARIDFTFDEAQALAAAAQPILADAGWRLAALEPGTRRHWFVTRDDGATIGGAAIERAIGDNVAAWQPKSTFADPTTDAIALAWRRCVNEIQMAWYAHPVNEAREARGDTAINTLWLSGNGAARTPLPCYAAAVSTLPLVTALPIDPAATTALETFDAFVEPARQDAWGTWREELQALDGRLAETIRRQAAGDVGTATLVFCGRDHARVVTLARGDRRKFWRRWRTRPSLVGWLTEPATP